MQKINFLTNEKRVHHFNISSKQLVNSWISGYFPYENPKYAFVVIMEKGDRHNPFGAVFAAREVIEYMRDYTSYTK